MEETLQEARVLLRVDRRREEVGELKEGVMESLPLQRRFALDVDAPVLFGARLSLRLVPTLHERAVQQTPQRQVVAPL